MTKQFTRALVARADDSSSGAIRFIASTEGVKRDGIDVSVDSWDLDNYRANPVVLWSHDYGGFNSPRPPIGRAETFIDSGAKALMADVTFDSDDEFARSIERKYRNGFLNAVSVGWDTSDDRNELLDISAVPVPGDPDALMERQLRGLADIGETLARLTDDPEPTQGFEAEALWGWAAYQMVRLFIAGADDGFDDRAYQRLARQYRRLDKTPPEVPDHLDALDQDAIRGLFLAGEPELVPDVFARSADTVLTANDWWR